MAMNAKISVFIICAEAIIYLLLYNLHDCTFKDKSFTIHHQNIQSLANEIHKAIQNLLVGKFASISPSHIWRRC